ncbi:MAG: AAA family ATPase [Spirochaetae bacterium HGW-Spirochaetae-8]|nr:MAG: AAA family ATPase [Spirochaetae bacterium HGW-Spirochaetae-8]
MIKRTAEATLLRLVKGFPVICVTGPRQSGKTTLVKNTFPDKPYISLEDPDIARVAREDPRGLLDRYEDGLILDEAQAVPEIFLYLKTAVDKDPTPGRYIVTGSHQFNLLAGVTESLAGRAAFLTLYPFSIHELKDAGIILSEPFKTLLKGFYPPLYDRDVTVYDWYTNYISSYIERDVRAVINVKDLGQFQIFVKMCASRVGQLLNLNALAQDCGITHNTAKAWLSVLESTGIVLLLKPYHNNYGKRLVKSPKLYFIDTGLLCRLLGIQNDEQLFLHPNRGNIFESFVVAEMLKTRLNTGITPELFFWRNNTGNEVDIVHEDGAIIRSVEIKSGKTFTPQLLSGLETWMRYSGESPETCTLVYAGDREMRFNGIELKKWDSLNTL